MGPGTTLTRKALIGAGKAHMTGLVGLDILRIGKNNYLFAGSESDGGLSSFRLRGGAAKLVDQLGYTSERGTLGLTDLVPTVVAGQPVLLPAGRWDDRIAIHKIAGNGQFDGVQILGASPDLIGRYAALTTLEVKGNTYVIASQWGQDQIQIRRLRDNLGTAQKRTLEDGDTLALAGVQDLAEMDVSGVQHFYTASADKDTLSSFTISKWGIVKLRDTLGGADGLGIDAPSAVDTVTLTDTSFVVLAAAGSDSLTVARVSKWGTFFVEDHEIDTRDTRFAGVSALTIIEAGNNRAFVAAGGADDGVSLFELAPNGQLYHLTSFADQANTSLQNISDLGGRVTGSTLQVYASSAVEPGLTQLHYALGTLAAPKEGGDGKDKLTGSSANDLILGYDGNDTIKGAGGADRLIDGAGTDKMWGGSGADTFVFTPDRRLDTVVDFEPGVDVLDLSEMDSLYDMDQLRLIQKRYGVLIRFEDERFRIEGAEDKLKVDDLTPDDFLF